MKISRFLIPVLVAVFCAIPQLALGKGQWKAVQTEDKDFSLSMPENAKSVDRTVKGIVIKAFAANEEGTNYSMTHGTGMKHSDRAVDAIIDGALAEFKKQAQDVGVELTVDKTTEEKGDGWSGKKTYLSIGKAKVEMLSAVSTNGNVGYCLVAASQDGAHAEPEFFSSFKVDNKRTTELYDVDRESIAFKVGQLLGFATGIGLILFVLSIPVLGFVLVRKVMQKKSSS